MTLEGHIAVMILADKKRDCHDFRMKRDGRNLGQIVTDVVLNVSPSGKVGSQSASKVLIKY